MGKDCNLDTLLQNEEEIDLTLSYSKVSDFDRNGPVALQRKTIADNKGIKAGSIIDDLLFSRDDFKSKYYISDYNEPASTLGVLCNIITENYEELPTVEKIFEIIKINELWKSTKNPELVRKYFDNDEFWGYITDRFKVKDKILITSDDKNRAEEIVSTILHHEFSKNIFDSNMDHIYQYKFEVQIKHFKFKGIIDIISIDHKNKKIYFKDLKTGANGWDEFLSSFLKFRYYFQEAVYCLAFEEVCKELQLEGYELQPFEFLYIGLKEKIPVSFVVPEKWHKGALEGFISGGKYYKGLYQLIDEIYFHWKNKIYDLPKEIYDNKGRITLKDNFIRID